MSSTRNLDRRFAWTDEQRAVEMLDWETKPEDFDRLCEHVIAWLCRKANWTQERLFTLMPEEQMRHEVRAKAQTFEERFISLPMFICLWFDTARLPQVLREKEERENHDT